MINMRLFQRNNEHTLSLRTLYIVMIYEIYYIGRRYATFKKQLMLGWRYVRDVTHYTP